MLRCNYATLLQWAIAAALFAAALAADDLVSPEPVQAPVSVLLTWDRSPSRSPECSCPRGTITPVYYKVYRLTSICPRPAPGEPINFDGFVPITPLIPDTSLTDTFNNGVDLRPGYYCYAVTAAYSRDEPVADVESAPAAPVEVRVWPSAGRLPEPAPGRVWAYILGTGGRTGFIEIDKPAGPLLPADAPGDDEAPEGRVWVWAWTADYGAGRVLIPAFAAAGQKAIGPEAR